MKKEISNDRKQELLSILKTRFDKNLQRHKDLDWNKIVSKLESNPEKLWSLNEMEISGGEPDVVGYNDAKDEFHIYDCAAESPAGRRSFCYDQEAWDSRKENKPSNNAMSFAQAMGAEILNEEQYKALQKLGKFDTKTSSWLKTPTEIRKLGGAIFGDFRYGQTFIYHNGAETYYAARGFRCCLKV